MVSTSTSGSSPQTQGVEITTLSIAQLSNLKNQLTQDLSNLTTSFAQLRAAQGKFRDCVKSIHDGVAEKTREGTQILVPLTSSLYVPGKIASTSTVLVDIGTGFYVEKTPSQAQSFYTQKVAELTRTLQELEGLVTSKQGNLKVVEDVLREKVLAETASAGSS